MRKLYMFVLALALAVAPVLLAQQSTPVQPAQQAAPAASAQIAPVADVPPPPPAAPKGPRVFLDSKSTGSNRNAARDQSMEMSKDFEKACTGVRITINQTAADYSVLLNHIEQGLIIRDNQFQIANRDGDLISNTKEGGSIAAGVNRACQIILTDWTKK
jgi:hypothetical protein